jgi:hypothetical protein
MKMHLSAYDPYDIWKTKFGLSIKNVFNHNRALGYAPAIVLTLFDTYVNNSSRLFYTLQEYPIVRAFAALALLELFKHKPKDEYLHFIMNHLEYLKEHHCHGYINYCWGIGFKYPVAPKIVYSRDTPFSTVTVYALEAFVKYSNIIDNKKYKDVIVSIYNFFNEDIQIMYEDNESMATSYGPWNDRIAFNAVAYSMYSLALSLQYIPEEKRSAIILKIQKMYRYIVNGQGEDGSWKYSPQGNSFIDCFHSCFVMKNIYKTSKIITLNANDMVIQKGYEYLISKFLSSKTKLFKRFAIKNKPSIVAYDLYDNAEVMNLANLLGDAEMVETVQNAISDHFIEGVNIYSQIDSLGLRHNRNTLRWAVMPYLYSLSTISC